MGEGFFPCFCFSLLPLLWFGFVVERWFFVKCLTCFEYTDFNCLSCASCYISFLFSLSGEDKRGTGLKRVDVDGDGVSGKSGLRGKVKIVWKRFNYPFFRRNWFS